MSTDIKPIQANTEVDLVVTIVDETGNAVDVSSATTIDFKLKKPDGTVLIKTGRVYTDGTDGKVAYKTTNTDIDLQNNWKLQVFIDIGTWSGHSSIEEFEVEGNL